MDAKLVIVGGKANRTEVVLNLPTIIGRSREAGLTIAHPMVSRQHCELYEDNGLLMVRDLGSLNGTFIHKERITEATRLLPNEEFTVGPLSFRAEYHYVGEIATAPTAAATEQPPEFPAFSEEPEDTTDRPGPTEQPWPAEPAPAGPEAGVEIPDFCAWDRAGQMASQETPPARSADYADDAIPAPAADAGWPGPAASPADQQGDFSYGPVEPEESLLDELPAEERRAAEVAPASEPPAQPPAKSTKASDDEEELDEFFKNLL